MGDYSPRSSRAELSDDSALSHKWKWPKHSTISENELPEPVMSDTVAKLEAANMEDESLPTEPRIKTGGRQKGTPNKMARVDIMKSAKVFSLQALGTLVDIMQDPSQPGATRVAAANSVLDRAFGKAKQITEIGGFDGGDIQTKLTIEFVGTPGQAQVTAAVPPLADGNVVDGVVRVVADQAAPAPVEQRQKRPWEA